MKVGDKLYCYNSMTSESDGAILLTIGKYYMIVGVFDDIIAINNDRPSLHYFSINISCDGLSYKTWFYSQKKIRNKKLEKLENYEYIKEL